jgi:thioredoxin-like negative regulator of GroEL
VHLAVALHAPGDLRLAHEVLEALLQHAGADPPQHVVAAAALQHHGRNPGQVQQLREQQARRPTPDDSDLGTHAWNLSFTRSIGYF